MIFISDFFQSRDKDTCKATYVIYIFGLFYFQSFMYLKCVSFKIVCVFNTSQMVLVCKMEYLAH